MLTLAIDTASSQTSIALLDGDKILADRMWRSEQNEAEKLLPAVMAMVPEINDVKRIIAVSGPGSFTSLRVGVTLANTLAYLTGAELYGVDTFAVWRARGNGDAILLIRAGKKEIFADGKLVALSDIDVKNAFGDLLPEQKSKLADRGVKFVPDSEIKSFGEAVARLDGLKNVKIIEPNYKRQPQITVSKDKWKKQKNLA